MTRCSCSPKFELRYIFFHSLVESFAEFEVEVVEPAVIALLLALSLESTFLFFLLNLVDFSFNNFV